VRREHGSAVANTIAREIVVAPHRDGGQAQFIVNPVPDIGDFLAPVMAWALSNLDRPLAVGDLAARAHMSPRTFARRFKDATGATPHSWLLHQRLARVEELLESTDLSIEEIARRVGYASATVLREQFQKRRGVAPRAYRRAFSAHAR
jgi:transcriptional regulator GlxA family with amidase domain